jgi:CDP-glucose 4,6-dehydratase
MENLVIDKRFWQGKKVLITGHTGFKGSWLSLWLQQLGAEVIGYAMNPPSRCSLFEKAKVAPGMTSVVGDIRDLISLKKIFYSVKPDIVIHMAAQSLVRYSYANPIETYQTNVMGTLHVLEAIRECESVRAAVMVTTDKCYENKEWLWAYRENEPMGGYDPYSSSKGCAELLIASYRSSFFSNPGSAAIASARAGNVIGGGDWAEDRLIPDIVKAFQNHKAVKIRNPKAVRPWQFVLEPLCGYLLLAEKLFTEGMAFAEAWNFGPKSEDMRSVQWIVEEIAKYYDRAKWELDNELNFHEAYSLKLDSTKAFERLKWQAQLSLQDALKNTVDWYQSDDKKIDMFDFCNSQIQAFSQPKVTDKKWENQTFVRANFKISKVG